ncbi:hypothetical protein [Rosenbergiella australiborealis]|nr:hypothetical protein [Rosenbergiella australiborealis]
MQGIIRLGDKTTHGGAVLSCSTNIQYGWWSNMTVNGSVAAAIIDGERF